jgi:predicted phosphodiesterase
MDTIILRFRDTEKDIDTISEHINMIDSKGFTWWGWWKKSSETIDVEIFRSLKNKISNGEIKKIGLFDRTTNRFFIAQISNIEYNIDFKINSPQANATPNYYNQVKLHCWFYLCDIQLISLEEFSKCFTNIPTRSDTLFVLPYEEEYDTERILIKNANVLHISDIHFGNDYGFPFTTSLKLGTNLLDIIRKYFHFQNKKEIGLLIVSGDITSRGDMGVLQGPASEFLKRLCEVLKINNNQVVIVPGNHDIPLKDANFHDYNHENSFKLFLKDFYGESKEINGYEKFITNQGFKIDILKINSARLRNKAESNFGYVGWDDYRYLIEENKKDDDAFKIAVLHHHLIPVPTEEPIDSEYPYGSISVTLDAGKVIEGLHHYDFDIVLHGHQHLPGLNKISRGLFNGDSINLDKSLLMSGAGSAGAKVERLNGQLRNNSFSILSLSEKNMKIESVQYNSMREPFKLFDTEIKIR